MQRRGVDGRDKPGHDDSGSKRNRQMRLTNSERNKRTILLSIFQNLWYGAFFGSEEAIHAGRV